MTKNAVEVAKQLHDKGYECAPEPGEKNLLSVAPSLAPALEDPAFRAEVDRELAQLWPPPSDTWKRFV